VSRWRADEPLELLHIDLCGPITPETAGGSKYFMLIVDDCTRWMTVSVLKSKDQASDAFAKFKAEAENSLGYKIKCVRSDRGGEFLAAAFREIYEKAGIRRQLTAPYSPQQNGIVERRNRTVMEMARSVMKSMKIPGIFWGEAVRHSVHLLNRLPTKPMGNRTPFEAWNGRKPQLGHLRVFGCKAHVRPAKPNLKKLDDRSVPMVYFGVEEGSKAHRLYDPQSKKIVVSRDVVFEENVSWDWTAEVGENSEFVVIETEEEAIPQYMGTGHGGINHADPIQENSGGVPEGVLDSGGASGSFQGADDGGNQFQQGGEVLSDTVHSQTTEGEDSVNVEVNPVQVVDDDNMDVDHDDGPVRFRSIYEVYEEAEEVELVSDAEIEINALMAIMEEPTCYQEAAGSNDWRGAMDSEIQSINKNKTWSLVKLPTGQRPIGLKWVFKLKKNAEGQVVKHKARLVAKGYVQKHGIDYDEVFAPVARLDTVRLLLAMAANWGWEVHHLDVKTAFLNGELVEDVYVAQPDGYAVKGKEKMVYKLSKALYGLKQAPRAWNVKLDSSLKKLGFKKCASEAAVYTRGVGKTRVILGVYVDDLIVTGGDPAEIAVFKRQMTSEFEMSDLGLLSYYLGIEVKQEEDCITIKQTGYAKKVLSRFGMQDCNPTKVPINPGTVLHDDKEGVQVDATEYRRIIGCLRYLLHTRPDLAFSVGMASRFMEKPTVMHQNVVKQILRYLHGTLNYGLVYTKEEKEEVLLGYSDSDLAGDRKLRRSTGGMDFYLNGGLITWCSHKEKTVALSSCKPQCVTIHVDNKSAIQLMKNPVFHGRSKHIDIKFHYIRECVERGQIAVKWIGTLEQKADSLTKAMAVTKLGEMRHMLGVRELEGNQA
jgi:hypothetical protein